MKEFPFRVYFKDDCGESFQLDVEVSDADYDFLVAYTAPNRDEWSDEPYREFEGLYKANPELYFTIMEWASQEAQMLIKNGTDYMTEEELDDYEAPDWGVDWWGC